MTWRSCCRCSSSTWRRRQCTRVEARSTSTIRPTRCAEGGPMLRSLALLLMVGLAACSDPRSHTQAVYMLVDTSGTFAQEAGKAQVIVNYLLGTLQSGDSLAVARVESRSFSEKDIVAKATFDRRPSQANAQKRAFRDTTNGFVANVKSSRYTDITGGLLQGAEFLRETGAGTKTLIIFSDM